MFMIIITINYYYEHLLIIIAICFIDFLPIIPSHSIHPLLLWLVSVFLSFILFFVPSTSSQKYEHNSKDAFLAFGDKQFTFLISINDVTKNDNLVWPRSFFAREIFYF